MRRSLFARTSQYDALITALTRARAASQRDEVARLLAALASLAKGDNT